MDGGSITREEAERMDFSDVCGDGRLPPVPPGEVLLKEFMEPLDLSARKLAFQLGMANNRISDIVNGDRSITAATAIKLAERFGTTAEFWMNLRTSHELEIERRGLGRSARGASEKAALNRRNPLTRRQRDMMALLKAEGALARRPDRQEATVLRSLRVRGYAEQAFPDSGPALWRLTQEGRRRLRAGSAAAAPHGGEVGGG